jgi:hypothetical protein
MGAYCVFMGNMALLPLPALMGLLCMPARRCLQTTMLWMSREMK